MRKIIAIGDTHGRKHWEKIVKKESDADKVIFIGDYFDSFTIPFEAQLENFMEILKFKNENPGKVVLIIGNHDFHYLSFAGEKYSGYQDEHARELNLLLEEQVENGVMQIAYQEDNFLFTHAGVTIEWARNNGLSDGNWENSLEELFRTTPQAFRFTKGDSSGDDISQSPIWVRPRSLYEDRLAHTKQVVGHSSMEKIIMGEGLHFIDTMGTSKEYLSIIDGVVEIKK
jgi:predicted phosphodiesterase